MTNTTDFSDERRDSPANGTLNCTQSYHQKYTSLARIPSYPATAPRARMLSPASQDQSHGPGESRSHRSFPNNRKRSSGNYQDITAKEKKRISHLDVLKESTMTLGFPTSNGEKQSSNNKLVPQEKKSPTHPRNKRPKLSKSNEVARPLWLKTKQQTQVMGRNINMHSKKKFHVFEKDRRYEASHGKQKQNANSVGLVSSSAGVKSKREAKTSEQENRLNQDSTKKQGILGSYKIPKKKSQPSPCSEKNGILTPKNPAARKSEQKNESSHAEGKLDKPKNDAKKVKQDEASDDDDDWPINKWRKRQRSGETKKQLNKPWIEDDDDEDDTPDIPVAQLEKTVSVSEVSRASKNLQCANVQSKIRGKHQPYLVSPLPSMQNDEDEASTDPNEEPTPIPQRHASASQHSEYNNNEQNSFNASVNTCVTNLSHGKNLDKEFQNDDEIILIKEVQGRITATNRLLSDECAADVIKPQNDSSQLYRNYTACSKESVLASDDDEVTIIKVVTPSKKKAMATLSNRVENSYTKQNGIDNNSFESNASDTNSLSHYPNVTSCATIPTTSTIKTVNSLLNEKSLVSQSSVQEKLLGRLLQIATSIFNSQTRTASSSSSVSDTSISSSRTGTSPSLVPEQILEDCCVVCKRRQTSSCTKCKRKCCYNSFCFEKHSQVC